MTTFAEVHYLIDTRVAAALTWIGEEEIRPKNLCATIQAIEKTHPLPSPLQWMRFLDGLDCCT